MTDTTQHTPLEVQMHELAEKISALSEEQKQRVSDLITGFLAAKEPIINKQSA